MTTEQEERGRWPVVAVIGIVAVALLLTGAIVVLVGTQSGFSQLRENPLAVSNAALVTQRELALAQTAARLATQADSAAEQRAAARSWRERDDQIERELETISMRTVSESSEVAATLAAVQRSLDLQQRSLAAALQGDLEQAESLLSQARRNTRDNALPRLQAFVAESAVVTADTETEASRAALFGLSIVAGGSLFLALAAVGLTRVWMRRLRQSRNLAEQRAMLLDENVLLARLDPTGEAQQVSAALRNYLRREESILVGDRTCFDNSDQAEDLMESVLAHTAGGQSWVGEIMHELPDGTQLWARGRVIPELDRRGQVTSLTLLLEDRTGDHLASMDHLTGVFNRRSFEEYVRREIRSATRHGDGLCLAVLDLDHFKEYNDRQGHPAGDRALQGVAAAMDSVMKRPSDYVFRIGGEEFALLFEVEGSEQANSQIARVRSAISATDLHHADGRPVTVSIGAAVVLPGELDVTFEHLYAAADAALYEAKVARDAVCLVQVQGGNRPQTHVLT